MYVDQTAVLTDFALVEGIVATAILFMVSDRICPPGA